MSIYIKQGQTFWKLDAKLWRRAVLWGLVKAEFDFNELVSPLKRRPSVIADADDSFYVLKNKHELHQPLDWRPANWLNAAYSIGLLHDRSKWADP